MLAEPSLLQYSQRVADDLPDDLAVLDYSQLMLLNRDCPTSDPESDEELVASLDLQVSRSSTQPEEVIESTLEVESLFHIELSSGFRTEILSVY
ncbi:hypothetical protein D3C77_730580 [compost metagenome]